MSGVRVGNTSCQILFGKIPKMVSMQGKSGVHVAVKPVPKHLVFSFVFGSLKDCFWFFGNTCFFDFCQMSVASVIRV